MMHYFEEVKIYGFKSGKCKCGKKRNRKKKFIHTLNPFNLNEKGVPKNRDEVYIALTKERNQWLSEPITCDNC